MEGDSGSAAVVPAQGMYTVEEALESIGFGTTQVIMFLFVGIAWAGDGMEMMLLSYLGPELRCKWDLTGTQESLITSVVFVGMMIGSYSWGAISDRYGRKIGYFAPAVFTAAFGILSATSPNYGALLFFRFCVGFGIAGAHVAYTLFMEFVAPGHRGQFLTLIEGFWTLGAIFLAGMAWAVLPTRGWRALVLVAAAPLIVLVAVYPFLKESPHWLLATGKTQEAQAVLEWAARLNRKQMLPGRLVGHAERHQESPGQHAIATVAPDANKDGVDGDSAAASAMPSLPVVGEQQQQQGTPESAPSTISEHFKGMFVGFGSSFRQMVYNSELALTSALLTVIWIGVALSYYGTILFGVELQTAKHEECVDGSAAISGDNFKDVFITSLGEIGGLVLCMLLVDFIGRRRCLWIFMLGTAVFTMPLFRQGAPQAGQAESHIDIIALFCTRMFAYGAFIGLFIYTPELYPTKIRSFAFGVFNALCRLGGLIAPFIAVELFHVAGVQAAAGVFVGVSLVASIVSMLLPIETMGRELPENVDDLQGVDSGSPSTWGISEAKNGVYAAASSAHSPSRQGSNPFTVGDLGQSSTTAQYQDQYGLASGSGTS